MPNSSDFMTMNGNLCLKRFIALLSLFCHSATQHPMLAPRGVQQHWEKTGWAGFSSVLIIISDL